MSMATQSFRNKMCIKEERCVSTQVMCCSSADDLMCLQRFTGAWKVLLCVSAVEITTAKHIRPNRLRVS